MNKIIIYRNSSLFPYIVNFHSLTFTTCTTSFAYDLFYTKKLIIAVIQVAYNNLE